jgi:hypothetical protein
LRTSFSNIGGKPVQIVAPTANLTLPLIDLSELADGEREAEIKRRAIEQSQLPFDLGRAPLLRMTLLRLGREDHVALMTMHHIVSDGWSIGVLIREVAALYRAFSEGRPSPLPELSIQYADFALWQRQWLRGEVLEQQLSYWKNQLIGATPDLRLPTDRPRPEQETYHGATQSFILPIELSEQLRSLTRQEGVTLFMTLLAAFQTLLYRLSGQDDICIGTPVANRNRVETEGLIGFFLNTLVLRADLSGDPSFRHLLARIREVTLGAYAHQDLPFEKLVEDLHPVRGINYAPLFQVWFVLQNMPMPDLDLPSLTVRPLAFERGVAGFDLILSMTEGSKSIRGAMTYKTDLFDADTISEILDHFEVLLKEVAACPDLKLMDIPLGRERRAGYTNRLGERSGDDSEAGFAF